MHQSDTVHCEHVVKVINACYVHVMIKNYMPNVLLHQVKVLVVLNHISWYQTVQYSFINVRKLTFWSVILASILDLVTVSLMNWCALLFHAVLVMKLLNAYHYSWFLM